MRRFQVRTIAIAVIAGALLVGLALWRLVPSSDPPVSVVQVRRPPPGYDLRNSQIALKQNVAFNRSPHVPPQCYTETRSADGGVHNPCYTCHIEARRPNFIDDEELQQTYAFLPASRTNPWTNLFVDWSPRLSTIGDDEIIAHIRQDNYAAPGGGNVLATILRNVPSAWDSNEDGRWNGYIPDAHFRFDAKGFDRGPDGGYSGWRAYAYRPVPGTFWPTNGSVGDALLRLPSAYRERTSGEFDLEAYELNLAVVQALIQRRNVPLAGVDELTWGVDLDLNGRLGRAHQVTFKESAEGEGSPMSYVGQAQLAQKAGQIQLVAGLYPQGTEFLHSVRYLEPEGTAVGMAARMKELRYARKVEWWSTERLSKRARREVAEAEDSPRDQKQFGGDFETGLDNGQGWRLQAFIEDRAGALRPQSFEETAYCIGCHGGLGATDDSIFSFGRQLDDSAFQAGWFHWSQHDLAGTPDRRTPSGTSEYVDYLEHNGAGDEFRQNTEIQERFFASDGKLKPAMRKRLQADVTEVLLPSRERALALNKAYRLLVLEQSFRLGRDLVLDGARHVHRQVEPEAATGISEAVKPRWVEPQAGVAARSAPTPTP